MTETAGDSVIYFDHAATSRPKPDCVVEAVTHALQVLGSPGRGAHSVALDTLRVVHESRSALASFLGVPDAVDLLFQPGCTFALNMVLKGLLKPGDRVVVSSMEHNAVARPLSRLQEAGVLVEVVDADPYGWIDPAVVERKLRTAPTRVVICQHVSNVTGTIQPIGDLTDVAHDAGALILVDGAQAVGHMPVDISAIGADVYAASGHKGLLGPQGVGFVYVAPEVVPVELVQGGTGSGSESVEQPLDRPARYEAGTANTLGIAGLGAATRWLVNEASRIRESETRLTRLLMEGLAELPVRVLGPPSDEPRGPLVSFVPEGMEPDRLAFRLDDEWRIAVRTGLHCAPWAHRSVGTLETGAVRFGIGWSTTEDEVREALAALAGILR